MHQRLLLQGTLLLEDPSMAVAGTRLLPENDSNIFAQPRSVFCQTGVAVLTSQSTEVYSLPSYLPFFRQLESFAGRRTFLPVGAILLPPTDISSIAAHRPECDFSSW